MKGRAWLAAAALVVGVVAGMLVRDLLPGRTAEAQEPAARAIHIRFQATAVPRDKGECSVFVVNQENGDLWRHDSATAGFVKVAGPIK